MTYTTMKRKYGEEEMDKINEICIVYSIDNYTEELYLKEFMKWIGISYFAYCYHEEFDELNTLLDKKNNKFDVIVYLNDKDARWRRRYQHLAKANIDVQLSDIWAGSNGMKTLQLEREVLKKMWEEILGLLDPENSFNNIIGELIDVFCEKNVLWRILRNEYPSAMLKNYRCRKEDVKSYIEEWNQIIEHLQSLKRTNRELYCNRGMENLDYAIKYSMRKKCEVKELINECESSEIEDIINSVNDIYAYNNKFYMGECLKGKIAMANMGQRIYAPFYFMNCVKACEVDACASVHYYRLGKAYELVGHKRTAYQIFKKSYELNQLNFRALFKVAVDAIYNENYVLAKRCLFQVLRILHLDRESDQYKLNMLKLPMLELEYACKCYILLGMIEEDNYGNYMNAEFYYEEANRIRLSVTKNRYINKMYPHDCEQIKRYLEERLSKGLIEKKLSGVQGMER